MELLLVLLLFLSQSCKICCILFKMLHWVSYLGACDQFRMLLSLSVRLLLEDQCQKDLVKEQSKSAGSRALLCLSHVLWFYLLLVQSSSLAQTSWGFGRRTIQCISLFYCFNIVSQLQIKCKISPQCTATTSLQWEP